MTDQTDQTITVPLADLEQLLAAWAELTAHLDTADVPAAGDAAFDALSDAIALGS